MSWCVCLTIFSYAALIGWSWARMARAGSRDQRIKRSNMIQPYPSVVGMTRYDSCWWGGRENQNQKKRNREREKGTITAPPFRKGCLETTNKEVCSGRGDATIQYHGLRTTTVVGHEHPRIGINRSQMHSQNDQNAAESVHLTAAKWLSVDEGQKGPWNGPAHAIVSLGQPTLA